MERPREFRRVVFTKEDLAEALAGDPAARESTVEISMMPKIVVKVIPPEKSGEVKRYEELDIINVLVGVCNKFQIPVPRCAEKRILIDRNRDNAIILQMAVGLF